MLLNVDMIALSFMVYIFNRSLQTTSIYTLENGLNWAVVPSISFVIFFYLSQALTCANSEENI